MSQHPVRPVSVTGQVPADPDLVFAFVSDTRNDPVWCDNVETVEMTSGDEVAVGTTFRFHQHLDRPGKGRVEFDVDVEVVELGERSITWHVSDRFQDRQITMTVEPDGTGCRVTQTTTASFHRPPGATKWLYPLFAKRIFKQQLSSLAQHFSPEN